MRGLRVPGHQEALRGVIHLQLDHASLGHAKSLKVTLSGEEAAQKGEDIARPHIAWEPPGCRGTMRRTTCESRDSDSVQLSLSDISVRGARVAHMRPIRSRRLIGPCGGSFRCAKKGTVTCGEIVWWKQQS